MLSAACKSSFVVCLLPCVWRVLLAVCCLSRGLLNVARCMLFGVRCSLRVACCVLVAIIRRAWFAVCCLMFVACCSLFAVCCLLFAN